MKCRSLLPVVLLPVALSLLGAVSACTASGADGSAAPSPTATANAGLGDRVTPTATAATVRDVEQLVFLTPSRNIGCDLRADMVRCDIGRKSWTPPPKPADCRLAWGNGVYVDRTKPAKIMCAGDSLLGGTQSGGSQSGGAQAGGTSELLPYGQAVRAGAFLCDSELTALHCENEKTGHGFTLSVQDYDLS